jgi:hypothetical protein
MPNAGDVSVVRPMRLAPGGADGAGVESICLWSSIPMYTNFASATLIVLGVVIAVLGFLLAGNLQMVVIGLLSVLTGGLLGLADRRRVA